MMNQLAGKTTETDAADAAGGVPEARRRLEKWGAAPLLFFALLPDKQYLFSAPRQPEWAVAYRVVGRHALALGDPLGDPEAAPEAAAAFLALCRRKRWKPCFYQITPAHLDAYRAAGLRVVKVGEEARIVLADWSLTGKKFARMRNDLRRVEKSGVVLEMYGPETPPDAACTGEMAAISRGWRQAHRAGEGTFAMGGFDPQSRLFAESRYFVARDSHSGRMLAFTSFIPIYGAGQVNGWTLDLMRRRADALHGVMEFLIVSAASQFAAEGAQIVSLGLSPLAGADDPSEAAATSHVRRFLYTRLGRVYNFQGLHTFKGKFATHWEPRFLVCSGGMAQAAGAILKAHTHAPGPLRLKPTRTSRSVQRRALVLSALMLLGLVPVEKTLAKRAALHPGRWGHFHAPHSPRFLHSPHFTLRSLDFHYSLRRHSLKT